MEPYQKNYDYQGAINNATGAYNQAAGITQQRQNELADYSKTMTNYGDQYGNYLRGAQSMYGFDPQSLMRAQQNLANTNTTIANLPQAVQQQGNYYGTTAGSMANNQAQMAGNLQGLLAGQSNAVNAYQSILGATQNQANQQATLGMTSEQNKANVLNQILSNALGFQGQQQEMVKNAMGQQNNYGAYLNAQKQAAAAQLAAQAQMTQSSATADQIRQQIALAQQAADAQKNLVGQMPGILNQVGSGIGNFLQGIHL